MDLAHHLGGDELALDGEGAGVLEGLEFVPEGQRLGRRLPHGTDSAVQRRLLRHEAEVT